MLQSFRLIHWLLALTLVVFVFPTAAVQKGPEAIELFNGKDLTGWGYKKGPTFNGKIESDDKRFSAKDGIIIVHPATDANKGVKQLWTVKEFPKDFELRLEFRAAVNADSGLFIRGPQLQVRDYLVAGPYKKLTKYKAQDWNEIVVVVKGQVAHCTCNGEVLEAALKVPKTGGIGLEADRGQMEYRNLRLKELDAKQALKSRVNVVRLGEKSMPEALRPLSLGKEGEDRLIIQWNDGHRGVYTWQHLRNNCPCAGCNEIREKPPDPFRILKPSELAPLKPVAITPVGYYAYKITWNDGHDTGIFTLENLRALCECEQCTRR